MNFPHITHQLSAELALLIIRAPELQAYLKGHAQILQTVLKPQGFGYATHSLDGKQIIYALGSNLNDLQTNEIGKNKLKTVFSTKLVNVFQSGLALTTEPSETQTSFIHHWVPCQLKGRVAFVLHFWFPENHPIPPTERLLLLEIAANQLSLCLKLQGFPQLSEAIAQANTHTHLLEELAGDHDLESIGWNLVNYARESLQCSRVSLFAADKSTAPLLWLKKTPIENRNYTIIACSGLKKVNKRSEHAVILASLAKTLLKIAVEHAPSVAQSGNSTARTLIGLAQRNHPTQKARPEAIETYFSRIPMNWAIVIPLLGRDGFISGLLLFEGQQIPENLSFNILRMRALAKPAGYCLSTALSWKTHLTKKWVTKWADFLAKTTPSWKRMMAKKWAIGLLIFFGIILFPLPHRVKGTVIVRPKVEDNIPAYRTAKLNDRYLFPVTSVKKGELLLDLDITDLAAELAQAKEALFGAEALIGQARLQGDERAEAYARISARSAEATVDALNLELNRSFIEAPFDGLLVGPSRQALRPGEIITAGKTLATVIDPTQWLVQMNLRDQDVGVLERRLKSHGKINGNASFIALPTHTYKLTLESSDQLTYGKSPFQEDYAYSANFTLIVPEAEGQALRQGYVGDMALYCGWQTFFSLLFRDFINFLKVRF